MKIAAFLLGVLCLWSWKPASAQSKCKTILTFNIILSVNNFARKKHCHFPLLVYIYCTYVIILLCAIYIGCQLHVRSIILIFLHGNIKI